MEPYRTHQQFALSPRQRALLVPLVHDIRAGLLQERAKAADRELGYRTPLEPLDLLLQEAAKVSYNLAEPELNKVSFSKPLLIRVLFELMQKPGVDNDDVTPDPALAVEWLRLYYFLSRGFTYHFGMREYHDFIAPFRVGVEQSPYQAPPRRHVNTAGMDEVAVFTALFNAAKPQGRGFAHDDPRDLTEEEGAALLQECLTHGLDGETPFEFDYVRGRRMKISVSELQEGYIDVTDYDEGTGEGTAQRAVEYLPRIF